MTTVVDISALEVKGLTTLTRYFTVRGGGGYGGGSGNQWIRTQS